MAGRLPQQARLIKTIAVSVAKVAALQCAGFQKMLGVMGRVHLHHLVPKTIKTKKKSDKRRRDK
jgi:hypothetical protein